MRNPSNRMVGVALLGCAMAGCLGCSSEVVELPGGAQANASGGPPPPPPINLKFFGTAKRGAGKMQAFLLQGEDVYLAAEGDIVARKYKIVSISNNSIRVTDLQNDNTQTLPLQN